MCDTTRRDPIVYRTWARCRVCRTAFLAGGDGTTNADDDCDPAGLMAALVRSDLLLALPLSCMLALVLTTDVHCCTDILYRAKRA